MWPFGKKKSDSADQSNAESSVDTSAPAAESTQASAAPRSAVEDVASAGLSAAGADADTPGATGVENGPFDIQEFTPDQFDFRDFAKASVNLGSVLLPIPHEGDIQVEMGPQGPTMLHIATKYGHLTPVAFAAPSSGGQWEPSAAEIEAGLRKDGLDVEVEEGPWGSEVVGKNGDMRMRIIGVDGPRWMLRITATGRQADAEQLAHIARGVLARTFVSRGSNPMPAGQPLPVTLPAPMAESIRKAYQAQAQAQNNQGQAPQDAAKATENPDSSAQ